MDWYQKAFGFPQEKWKPVYFFTQTGAATVTITAAGTRGFLKKQTRQLVITGTCNGVGVARIFVGTAADYSDAGALYLPNGPGKISLLAGPGDVLTFIITGSGEAHFHIWERAAPEDEPPVPLQSISLPTPI